MDAVRVDIWLHAVRLFKTRSAANTAVKGGKIKVDGEPVKPSHKLRVGQTITFRQPGRERIIEVTGLLEKRVGYPVAIKHYIDHPNRFHGTSWPSPSAIAGPVDQQKKNAASSTGYAGTTVNKGVQEAHSWRSDTLK